MKRIAFYCIAFLFISMDQIQAPRPDPPKEEKGATPEVPQIIRAAVPPTSISKRLQNIEESLQIKDGAEHISSTPNEALWIDRFTKTMKNWLSIVTEVAKLESYQNSYRDLMKHVYDECIYDSGKNPIQIRYRKTSDSKLYVYNFIPRWICFSGFGLGSVNVKQFDINFEKSKRKMETPFGKMVFRKDRIYNAKIELTVPWIYIRVEHLIVQYGEQPDTKEKLSNGSMRLQLNDVKINMSMQLAEIDKRFVQKNPDTGLTYYFRLPKLEDLSISLDNVQHGHHIIQKNLGPNGGNIGKGLNINRAEKIIVDLVELFKTEAGRKEICNRLKPVLVNKSAEAIMTSPDVLSIAKHVVLAWDEDEPEMPPAEWTSNEIKLWHEAFYAGYNTLGLVTKALNFMITHFQNVRNDDIPDVDVLGNGPPKEYDVGKISVHYDGLDYS